MGVSAGGLTALTAILPRLSQNLSLPLLIVQHMSPDSDDFLAHHFDKLCASRVKEAEDKEPIKNNVIYFAPANYHMLVEQDRSLALSTTERIQYSRPAIDILFETAAEAYLDKLVGIILTGANSDGTQGMRRIKELNGFTIAQSPKTAEADAMPRSAITRAGVDQILDLEEIAPFLNLLGKQNRNYK